MMKFELLKNYISWPVRWVRRPAKIGELWEAEDKLWREVHVVGVMVDLILMSLTKKQRSQIEADEIWPLLDWRMPTPRRVRK